jgi:F-type H+-transporting ATPase subunit b
MISLDFSVVYQIIFFLVLLVILNKVLFRPYLALLAERERKTSGTRHETSDLEHEGARLRAQHEEKIAQAQAAGSAAKEAILQDARRERERIVNQARAEASSSLERVRQEVQGQVQKERQLAAAEVATLAQQMAGKILGRNVA